MKKYELAIVVPIYNVQRYLLDCLLSLDKIMNGNVVVILINDGSSDDSESIVTNFIVDKPDFIYRKKVNGGLSSARNQGIKIALDICDYISFVDSDDLVDESYFQVFEKNKGADIISFNAIRFSELGDNLYEIKTNIVDSSLPFKLNEEYVEKLSSNMKFQACFRFFKADLFYGTSLFPEGRLYEDLYLIPQLYLKAEMITELNEAIYFYRFNPNSITSRPKLSAVDDLVFLKEFTSMNSSVFIRKLDQIIYHVLALNLMGFNIIGIFCSMKKNNISYINLLSVFKFCFKITIKKLLCKIRK
ncbi:putative Glyco_trans_2-like domain-containing protein [Vibrio chagasii]|nr:putative Glyco_trans_2-like domain-containing protein [Vibrio chagasii]